MTPPTPPGSASVPAAPDPPSTDPSPVENASTGELVRRLSTQVTDLVRGELALAKAELTDKGKRAGAGAGLAGAAGVVALYGGGESASAGHAVRALSGGGGAPAWGGRGRRGRRRRGR